MKYLTLLLLLPLLACDSSDTEDAAILSIATEAEDVSWLTLDDYPYPEIRHNEQLTVTFSHRPEGLKVTGALGWQLDGNVLHIERTTCWGGAATLNLDWSSGSRTYRFRCHD